jgi:hypothetical protein
MVKLKAFSVKAYCGMVLITLFCLMIFSGCAGESTKVLDNKNESMSGKENLPVDKNPGNELPSEEKKPVNELPWDENLYGPETQYWQDKKYWDTLTPDNVIQGDKVHITLSKFASFNFEKLYTEEDFPDIDLINAFDYMADNVVKLINMQFEAERTGDWSELQELVNAGFQLIDLDAYRREVILVLKNQGVESVRNAIKLLEERRDFIYVGPNLIPPPPEHPYAVGQ